MIQPIYPESDGNKSVTAAGAAVTPTIQLHQLFEAHVRRSPHHPAVRIGGREWSYVELNTQANRIAHYLKGQGFTSGTPVGLCLPPSFDLLAGVFGILKAGGLCVPIDPDTPPEACYDVLYESGATWVLTSVALQPLLPITDQSVLLLDVDWDPNDHNSPLWRQGSDVGAEDQADLASRSAVSICGTVGNVDTRRVLLDHGAVAESVLAMAEALSFTAADVLAPCPGMPVDTCLLDMLTPCLIGATLSLGETVADQVVAALIDELLVHQVSILRLTPGWLMYLIEYLERTPAAGSALVSLRLLLLSGDRLSRALCARFADLFRMESTKPRLVNLYSTAEVAGYASWSIVPDTIEPSQIVPLGRPLASRRFYVVGSRGALLPKGIPGELYIGGGPMAHGYVGDEELTAARFLNDTFSGTAGGRLFKTGAIVQRREGGSLEVIGLVEDRLVLNGFQVDSCTLEDQLRGIHGVADANMQARTVGALGLCLVAYIVLSNATMEGNPTDAQPAELQKKVLARQVTTTLEKALPDHRVPKLYVFVDQLPLTRHGRIDRDALPVPLVSDGPKTEFVAPTTKTEIKLAELWQDVLKVAKVGVHDNFFSLGGHSMLATQLLSRVRRTFKVELPVVTLFENPVLESLAICIDQMLLGGESRYIEMIQAVPRESAMPLSRVQERLWFIHEHRPDLRKASNMPTQLSFRGRGFSLDALCRAFNTLIARHESLRTTFVVPEPGAPPVQVIAPSLTLDIPLVEATEAQAPDLAHAHANHVFDLSRGPLLKVSVLRLATDHHVLLLNMHHIISDGWSIFNVMFQEVQALYTADLAGQVSTLPPMPIQYADYAVWERERNLTEDLEYWKQALHGYEDGLQLPYDRMRSASGAWRVQTVRYRYPQAIAQRLGEMFKASNTTLFMGMVASVGVVLSRYTGRDDVCIGTTVAGRSQVELESLIGFFVNILPLRLDLTGNPSLAQVLAHTRAVVLAAFEHDALPFEHLLNALHIPRDSGRTPLVPVIVRHQNFLSTTMMRSWSDDLDMEQMVFGERTTQNELDLQFYGDGTTLEVVVEYAAELFDAATIERLLQHHEQVLYAMMQEVETPLVSVPLLTLHEQLQFERWNATTAPVDLDDGVAARFVRAAAQTPTARAVIDVHGWDGTAFAAVRTLDYAALNRLSNQVAHRLTSLGVGPGVRVAVYSERSLELVIGMLGIFKAGGCYVPLPAQYPAAYQERILANAQPQVILASTRVVANLSTGDALRVVLTLQADATLADTLGEEPCDDVVPTSGAGALACLLYTSGSTGKPKGVMVPQAQIINCLDASWQRVPFMPGEMVLQKTSVLSGVSIKELLGGLLMGVPQVMLADEIVQDTAGLRAALDRWQVTRLFLVPSHLQALLDSLDEDTAALRALRVVTTAAEPLPVSLRTAVRARLPWVALRNNYGCTEFNDVSYCEPEEGGDADTFVPIGTPIANTQVYVLDEQLRPVPLGVLGELHVDSVGMALGYWDQPDQTAERFIPNPFTDRPGGRLYKTGDLVRRLNDGVLEYLGRRNFEVKVRGYRVDLQQVEKVARDHPALAQVVASGWPLGASAPHLALYYVVAPGSRPTVDALRDHMVAQLPGFMVPTLYYELSAVPRLPNGKLDRRSLPAPDMSTADDQYVTPRTATEQTLCQIWQDVLQVRQVGIHDNFFALGGHSLVAAQLISRVRYAFGAEVPIKVLFENPILSHFAQLVNEYANKQPVPDRAQIPIIDRNDCIPLSHHQSRLWFIHEHIPEQRSSYNVALTMRVQGEQMSAPAMCQAFNDLVARHESLRTRFVIPEPGAEPIQVISDSLTLDIPVYEVTEDEVESHIKRDAAHSFDLSAGPLLKVSILRLSPSEHVLLVNMHHIITDGWSLFNVMMHDVQELYGAVINRRPPELPPLPIQFADYAAWQRQRDYAPHLEYWKTALEGYQDDLPLPYDHPRPYGRAWRAGNLSYRYPSELVQEFSSFTQFHGVTLFVGLLASFAVVLHQYTGRDDICIGTTTAGRDQMELENLIGFFINVLPLRIDLSGDPSIDELVQRTRRVVLDAFKHQDLPFEHLLKDLNLSRDSSRVPLVPVVVRHQNFMSQELVKEWSSGVSAKQISWSDQRTTPNELDLQFYGDGTSLELVVEYALELFAPSTILRMVKHHRKVMEMFVASMNRPRIEVIDNESVRA